VNLIALQHGIAATALAKSVARMQETIDGPAVKAASPIGASFRPLGRARFDDRSNVYSRRPSRSAQAVATAELGVSVPGTVAQPPFSMINRRSHDEALLNSVNFAGASACCWNLSTQIGASTSTTAVSARSFATRSAVPPSVHPKIVKPSTDMAAAPMTTPQIPGFILGGKFIDLMSCAPVSAPLVHSREISAVGARDNTCDHVCEEPRECRLVPSPVSQPVSVGMLSANRCKVQAGTVAA
jgi:hypothetical protein